MRCIRLAIAGWLSLAVFVGIALLYGRAYPTPNGAQVFGLDRCNGSLCFIGVVPGITSPEDAASILTRYGAVQPPVAVNFGVKYVIGDAYIDFDGSRTTIIRMSIFSPPDKRLPVTVGDVLSHLGPPCRMSLDAEGIWGIHLYLAYPDASIDVASGIPNQNFVVNVDTPISGIDIFPVIATVDRCDSGRPWVDLKHFNWEHELRSK
jgi:hypothetical protein